MKRIFDFLIALVLLVVLSPLMAMVAIAVRASSTGPAIFRQVRVGRYGEPFVCLKFRTMYQGTAAVPTHMASSSSVTSLGSLLRKTKLDELPQLINVVRGEMSLVGPRPCLPQQAELIEKRRALGVLEVRPGITGVSQIAGIDMSDPDRLARSDAAYLSQESLWRDLRILSATFFGVGRGDRIGTS